MSENNTPAGNTAVPEAHTVDSIMNGIGYDGFVRALFSRTGDPSKDFAHAALGIVTEVFELRHATDKVNQTEEGGDLTFYGHAAKQVIRDYLGETEGSFDSGGLVELLNQLNNDRLSGRKDYLDTLTNDLLDDAKRWAGYGKAPANPSLSLARCLYVVFGALEDANSEDVDTLKRVNIAKLLERYKGLTFTANAAINRDVDAERRVMENAGA